MTYKEAVHILEINFMKDEKEALARALASLLCDIHQLVDIDEMSEKEFLKFTTRMEAIDATTVEIVNGKPYGGIKFLCEGTEEHEKYKH